MQDKFVAVVYKSTDYKESDKRLLLITPEGVKTAVMKGVKKPSAKLRFAAMPFAFCEYTAVEKGGFLTVTSASQMEDLFGLTADPDRLLAASVILESAFIALKNECSAQFIFTLHRLNECLNGDAFIAAVRQVQYLIHDAGYGYDYLPPQLPVSTPLKLLAYLNDMHPSAQAPLDEYIQDKTLVLSTLKKLIKSFEQKFETELITKKLLP